MIDNSLETAKILSQALPYIQQFRGKTVVIKYGGNAMIDSQLKQSFAKDVTLLKSIGVSPIIVHGGGPQIGILLDKLGKESTFIDGMRITDEETLDIAEMVLGGQVNKSIVNLILNVGGKAVGLTGKDGNLLTAKKYQKKSLNDEKIDVDLGFVGEIEKVDTSIITTLVDNDFIPIIAPIGRSQEGVSYNINADLVASAIAISLKAEKLLLLTNTPGLMTRDNKVITCADEQKIYSLIEDKTIHGGMLPKIHCALDAIEFGVNSVHIIDGRVEHSILLEILTSQGVGTLITHNNQS